MKHEDDTFDEFEEDTGVVTESYPISGNTTIVIGSRSMAGGEGSIYGGEGHGKTIVSL